MQGSHDAVRWKQGVQLIRMTATASFMILCMSLYSKTKEVKDQDFLFRDSQKSCGKLEREFKMNE